MFNFLCPQGGLHDWEITALYSCVDAGQYVEDKVCLKCERVLDRGASKLIQAEKEEDRKVAVNRTERRKKAQEILQRHNVKIYKENK